MFFSRIFVTAVVFEVNAQIAAKKAAGEGQFACVYMEYYMANQASHFGITAKR